MELSASQTLTKNAPLLVTVFTTRPMRFVMLVRGKVVSDYANNERHLTMITCDCETVIAIPCTCGDCDDLPPESKGEMCATCGEMILTKDGNNEIDY